VKLFSLLYKKDLNIENPKKFQRYVSDVASSVLFKKGYYLNRTYSKFPYLNASGITNIADFHGLLCFVKNHSNYNLVLRIIGVILIVVTTSIWLYPVLFSFYSIYQLVNFPAFVGIGIGIFLIFFKFGKDICIEIRLVGESYRTDIKKEENTIEYLSVRSHARLTVQAATLNPKKTLSDNDIAVLHKDGNALTSELTLFLEKYTNQFT